MGLISWYGLLVTLEINWLPVELVVKVILRSSLLVDRPIRSFSTLTSLALYSDRYSLPIRAQGIQKQLSTEW
jgi:hypothetical protein